MFDDFDTQLQAEDIYHEEEDYTADVSEEG